LICRFTCVFYISYKKPKMKKTYKYLLMTVLTTIAFCALIVLIGEIYFKINWEKGFFMAFFNELDIIVYSMISFFMLLSLYLLRKMITFSKRNLNDSSKPYLYSFIYALILLTTVCSMWFLKL